jgi:hypothetical protein
MTSGIARPNACGHAITRTVTVLVIAWSTSPATHHPTNVMIAAAVAT